MRVFDMVSRALVLLTAILLCISIAAALEPINRPTDLAELFPVMAWDAPPNDLAVLTKMHECGFTVAGFMPPTALDNCQSAGLRAIVSDPRVGGYNWTHVDPAIAKPQVAELVAEVRNHPAVYGYYLRDEPTANFFPGLAVVSNEIKKLHPGAWPYINLFPNYANAGQLGAPSYDEYLDKFIESCAPSVLSYDHYALLEGGALRDEYFANLEAVRRAAQKHKIPFWNIVLSTRHFTYREVSSADLRFQAYTSLAYGARGLAWFKYFTPTIGNFRDGPIDQFGHETPTWSAMQNVNLQIGKLGTTLLKLTSDRVYHFGTVPAACAGADDKCLVKSVAGQILVGDFTHEDGTRYVMIVNRDFTQSVYCSPQFREAGSKVEQVSPYSGQLTPFSGEYAWLAPGQGALLKLSR
jgi:hypothetical protein